MKTIRELRIHYYWKNKDHKTHNHYPRIYILVGECKSTEEVVSCMRNFLPKLRERYAKYKDFEDIKAEYYIVELLNFATETQEDKVLLPQIVEYEQLTLWSDNDGF